MLQQSAPNYPHSVPHLFPTNHLVSTYNAHVFATCTNEKVTVKAVDSVIGDFRSTEKERIKSSLSQDPTITSGLLYELHVAVNMRYKTVLNISVEDGNTNGSSCVVKKIHYIQPTIPMPSVIWVLFDDERVGRQTRFLYKSYFQHGIPKEWTPIFATKRTFFATRCYVPVIRTQFPLRPAAAKTIHKSQGETLDEVVIHMGL